MKKHVSMIMKTLYDKGFAELHSDWLKLIFVSQAFVGGHANFKNVLPHTPTVGQYERHHLKIFGTNLQT